MNKLCYGVVTVLLAAAPGVWADQVTLNPTQDTYVQSINPDVNYGKSEDMLLGKGTYFGLGFVRGLVQFDLSSLPTNPELITSATLSLYQYRTEAAAGGLPVDVKRITGTWSQTTVTWNFHPTYDDAKVWASASVGDSFYTGWINWDVLDLVKNQVSGQTTHYGWLLKFYMEITAGASRLGYFHTMDYTANPERRPKLVVDYVPEPASGLLLLGVAALVVRRR